MKVSIKPSSLQEENEWIPGGMIWIHDGPNLTERKEAYENIGFDTKQEADLYFIQASEKKYAINR